MNSFNDTFHCNLVKGSALHQYISLLVCSAIAIMGDEVVEAPAPTVDLTGSMGPDAETPSKKKPACSNPPSTPKKKEPKGKAKAKAKSKAVAKPKATPKKGSKPPKTPMKRPGASQPSLKRPASSATQAGVASKKGLAWAGSLKAMDEKDDVQELGEEEFDPHAEDPAMDIDDNAFEVDDQKKDRVKDAKFKALLLQKSLPQWVVAAWQKTTMMKTGRTIAQRQLVNQILDRKNGKLVLSLDKPSLASFKDFCQEVILLACLFYICMICHF